jgi:hypothetical protein
VLHWLWGAGTGQEGVFDNNINNALAQPSPGAPISMNWFFMRRIARKQTYHHVFARTSDKNAIRMRRSWRRFGRSITHGSRRKSFLYYTRGRSPCFARSELFGFTVFFYIRARDSASGGACGGLVAWLRHAGKGVFDNVAFHRSCFSCAMPRIGHVCHASHVTSHLGTCKV